MEDKNVEKVDNMASYEYETSDAHNECDEFSTMEEQNERERKHEISFFGEFVPDLQTFSPTNNWWSRASTMLKEVAEFISGMLFLVAGLVYSLAIWLDRKKEREQDMEPIYARHTSYRGV